MMRHEQLTLILAMATFAAPLLACSSEAGGGLENTAATAQKLSGGVLPLLSNLNKPPRAGTTMDGSIWAAQGFTTGLAAYTLVDIEASVGAGRDVPQDVTAELRQGAPDGVLVAQLTVPNLAGTPSPRHFAPLNPVTLEPAMITLDPATTYYVVLHVDSGAFELWYVEDESGVEAEAGPALFGDYAYKYPDQSPGWDGHGTENPYYLRVNVLDSTSCTL